MTRNSSTGDLEAPLVRIKDLMLSLPAVTCFVIILPAFVRKLMKVL